MGHTMTPLRYPGGKTRLFGFVNQIFVENEIEGGVYIEPYAGGAGLGLKLLFKNTVNRIIINDINRSIYSFWYSVLNSTDDLCRLIQDTPVTIDEWLQQKRIQEVAEIDLLSLGFSTFFLNRTNRSGIILGGVIGGTAQEGDLRLDARFPKHKLIEKIQRVASYRNHIEIRNQDAVEFIHSIAPDLNENSLFYLDPPYFKKGAGLYENHYELVDHTAVGTAIQNMPHKWLVSYDNVPEIRNIYDGYRNIQYELSYSIGRKYQGEEIIFFSPDLVFPNIHPVTLKPLGDEM